MTGVLALVGGGEWQDGCDFDRDLLAAAGGADVLVLPTAAAYEHPGRLVEQAAAWFDALGGRARGLMVLSRPDAEDEANVAAVRESAFTYMAGTSPMHLRSVLKDSALWQALEAAWDAGGVLAASSAGAMVLCDPMVDPRGGAFTLGLGLVSPLALIPHHETWSEEKAKRTIALAPKGLVLVGIDEQTALIRSPEGGWRVEGAGQVVAFRDGRDVDLDALPR